MDCVRIDTICAMKNITMRNERKRISIEFRPISARQLINRLCANSRCLYFQLRGNNAVENINETFRTRITVCLLITLHIIVCIIVLNYFTSIIPVSANV